MERGNARLKFIDRFVGPVLLAWLAPLARFPKRNKPTQVSSVAIIKTAAIGDTVLMSAVINDLKRAFPSADLTLFVGSSNFEFAKLLKHVDHVVKLPLTKPLGSIKLLRSREFDVVIDSDSWPRISALFATLAKAKWRIGFRTAKQFRHYGFDEVVDHSNSKHEIDNYRALAERIGAATKELPQDLGNPWLLQSEEIAFHFWPGGTKSHLKEWNSEQWIALARKLLVMGKFRFVLSGAPSDKARNDAFISSLPEDLSGKFTNAAGISLAETIGRLSRVRLLVSVNTGIMHIGAALGTPTVGLHGPTNPLRWGPIGKRVRSVASKNPQAGKLNLGFEYESDLNLMDDISLTEVEEACRSLLKETETHA